MNVFIINQFADNKGDRAVLHVLVQLICEIQPTANITVSTTRPEAWSTRDLPKRKGGSEVTFVPWSGPKMMPLIPQRIASTISRRLVYPSVVSSVLSNRGLKKIVSVFLNGSFLKALREADIVISTGGHHFTNWFAKSGMSVLFQDLALAILYNKPTYLWSQTIGPLTFTDDRNQKFLTKCLESCQGIYVRDKVSYCAAAEVGVSSDLLVETLESVFALKVSEIQPPSKRPRRVGIAIYTGPVRDAINLDDYHATIAEYTRYAVSQGYEVVFFPMQIAGQYGDDRPQIHTIVDIADCKDSVRILEEDLPTDKHVQEVAKCQIYLAHKTHAVVFSLATGTPTIAIAYHPKASDFMALYGQGEHCINEVDLTSKWLKECHCKCENQAEELHVSQLEITRCFKQKISANFRRIMESVH